MTNEDNTFGEDLRQAVEVLRHGGLILYPTDTVWGIGCDATNKMRYIVYIQSRDAVTIRHS